jgi:hypothetical protein
MRDIAALQAKDTFDDALHFVNRLFDAAFGVPVGGQKTRRAVAHVPHLLRRSILQDMRAKWPKEFERTSSHRFRHPHDLQYAFMYIHFMMNRHPVMSEAMLVHDFIDTNHNGALDESELNLVMLILRQQTLQGCYRDAMDSFLEHACLQMQNILSSRRANVAACITLVIEHRSGEIIDNNCHMWIEHLKRGFKNDDFVVMPVDRDVGRTF